MLPIAKAAEKTTPTVVSVASRQRDVRQGVSCQGHATHDSKTSDQAGGDSHGDREHERVTRHERDSPLASRTSRGEDPASALSWEVRRTRGRD